MVFSKEEQQIWANSEVMRELERIARAQTLEMPEEEVLSPEWEEESDEEKLTDALNEFEGKDTQVNEMEEQEDLAKFLEAHPEILKKEMNLINDLTKLASFFGKQGKVICAHKIEDTIRDIQIALREAQNG